MIHQRTEKNLRRGWQGAGRAARLQQPSTVVVMLCMVCAWQLSFLLFTVPFACRRRTPAVLFGSLVVWRQHSSPCAKE